MVVVPWPAPLKTGIFLKRYKRFFADIDLDGSVEVAHVANTGSLKGLLTEGCQALVLPSSNPKRKLKYSLKALQLEDQSWVGVDTGIPSQLLSKVLTSQPDLIFPNLKNFKLEHKISAQTRLDALVTLDNDQQIYIELKNVTMGQYDPTLKTQTALFPDAVTERGLKHLIELQDLVSKGHRATLIFMIQRTDCNAFRPAHEVDLKYAQELIKAQNNGVELIAYSVKVDANGVTFTNQKLPIHF